MKKAKKILGGDVAVSLVQQDISAEQLQFLEGYGSVSKSSTLRAMGRLPDGSDQTLIELKSVDTAYPLFGTLEGVTGSMPADALGDDQVLIEALLGERLKLAPGDKLVVGTKEFLIKDVIADEPDRLGENFGFGPRVLIGEAGLISADLLKPGSLITNAWKIKLNDPSAANVSKFTTEAKDDFPNAGWRIRSRDNAAPALSRNIERFLRFSDAGGADSSYCWRGWCCQCCTSVS